jgi:hypothetical protein
LLLVSLSPDEVSDEKSSADVNEEPREEETVPSDE